MRTSTWRLNAGQGSCLFILLGLCFALVERAAGALGAAVPVVDHLGRDEAVHRGGHDVREDDDRVSRLLDGREDPGRGAAEQQENGHGRQLAGALLAVVGHGLDQLQRANEMTRQIKTKNKN